MKFYWHCGKGKIIEVKSKGNEIIDYAVLFRDSNDEDILVIGEVPETHSLRHLEDIFFQHNKDYFYRVIGGWAHDEEYTNQDVTKALEAYENLNKNYSTAQKGLSTR